MIHRHGVETDGGSGDVHLLHIVAHIVTRRGQRTRIGRVQDVGSRGPTWTGDAQIQIIHQIGSRVVQTAAGRTCGICPADSHADGIAAIPREAVALRALRRGELVLDQVVVGRRVLVGHDHLRCRLRVHEAPAIRVVRACIAEVICGVNDQPLQSAGTHRSTVEFVRVKLLQEQGRATSGRGGHARSAHGRRFIISSGRSGKDIHTDSHNVRLDASVIGRAPA